MSIQRNCMYEETLRKVRNYLSCKHSGVPEDICEGFREQALARIHCMKISPEGRRLGEKDYDTPVPVMGMERLYLDLTIYFV